MPVSDFKITATTPRVQYVATALQTTFSIPFRFFDDGDIEVYLDENTIAVNPNDYTLTGAGTNSNGSLIFDVGQPLDTGVTIVRNSVVERTTNFSDSGDWQAQNVNNQFNRLTTYIQEVALKTIDLALTLPITSTLDNLSVPDEGSTNNANKVWMWDPTGTFLINGPTAENIANAELILTDIEDISDEVSANLVLAQDAANVALAAAAGMKWKTSVRVASIGANINIASAPASIDGVALVNGNRVLLKDQTSSPANGIYVWNGTGQPMTRATDADSWLELVSATVAVEDGTTPNIDQSYICTVNQGGTLGVTNVTWSYLVATVLDASITIAKLASTVYASQVEAEAGAENTKLMTSLRVRQAIVAMYASVADITGGVANKLVNAATLKAWWDALVDAPDFISGELTVTYSSSQLVAHGLGARPSRYEVWLRFKASTGNWANNDEVPVPDTGPSGGSYYNVLTGIDSGDTANIRITCGAAISLINKTTGAGLLPAAADLRYIVRAWK